MNLTWQSYNNYKIVNKGGKLVIWGYSSWFMSMNYYNVSEVVFVISN